MDKKTNKINLLFSIIFFALSCGLFYFLYWGVNNNRKVFSEAEHAWKREEDRLEAIRTIDRSIKTVEMEKLEFESHFARKSDIVPFLDSLEGLARDVGAVAEVVSVDTGSSNSNLTLAIQASGSFDSIYKFLTLLENSYYELQIINFSMQRDSFSGISVNKYPKWKAVITIKLISYLPE